jgi:hypothetical protein
MVTAVIHWNGWQAGKKQLLKYVCESLEESSHLIETSIKCSCYIFEAENFPVFNSLQLELGGRESDESEAGREIKKATADRM